MRGRQRAWTRRTALVMAAGVAVALSVVEASPAATSVRVTASGTQTTRATVANRGCSAQGVARGDLTETVTWRTYQSVTLSVVTAGQIAFAESGRPMRARGRVVRTSTLGADGKPLGCDTEPSSCGARQFTAMRLQVFPVFGGSRFRGVGVNNAASGTRDPFRACAGPTEFPVLVDRPNQNSSRSFYAAVPASFFASCRRGTLTRTGRGIAPFDEADARGQTSVGFTMTLTRLGCR